MPAITEWTVNDDYYVIDFENNSLDNTAWFDHLGVWAMIKTDLPLNQLPTAISNDIKQGKYAGWKDRGSRYKSAEPEWEPYIK